jgi:hypothetical protein
MKIGHFYGKWIKVIDNPRNYRNDHFVVVSKEDWEIIKQLDNQHLLIVATVLHEFDAKIVNYGWK